MFSGCVACEAEGVRGDDDLLAEDSLLMEGIPRDAIFGTGDIMENDPLFITRFPW